MLISKSETVLYHSPCPAELYCYTPALAHGFNSRIFASFDLAGDALAKEDGPKSSVGDRNGNQMRIYVSDDQGNSWRETGRLPMLHARVFTAGETVYAIGHGGDLLISRSTDNGETWEPPVVLNSSAFWHQSAGTIEYANGRVYLVMEHAAAHNDPPRGGGDPVLMAADVNADLTKRENWTFSNVARLEDYRPYLPKVPGDPVTVPQWLESCVVFQRDMNNFFYDPDFRKPLILLRTRNRLNMDTAMMLQGVEHPDGALELTVPRLPDGTPVVLTPLPGGYMKFQIIWDEPSKRYWLIASRTEFSTFTKRETLPDGVFWVDERQRLELYYSTNLFDWCCAGVVAKGAEVICSRHYASLLACGNDLLVLSRSGDTDAASTHDTDMITLHRIPDFRSLVL